LGGGVNFTILGVITNRLRYFRPSNNKRSLFFNNSRNFISTSSQFYTATPPPSLQACTFILHEVLPHVHIKKKSSFIILFKILKSVK
jgi:hypothetical protein